MHCSNKEPQLNSSHENIAIQLARRPFPRAEEMQALATLDPASAEVATLARSSLQGRGRGGEGGIATKRGTWLRCADRLDIIGLITLLLLSVYAVRDELSVCD